MAHHKYSTSACVIEVKPRGEGDAIITLVTESLGLIRATAKGLRLSKSKLRQIVRECGEITVSVVKGREVWHLTSAVGVTSWYEPIQKMKGAKRVAWSIHSLLSRLAPQGEFHPELLQIILGLWQSLATLQQSQHKALECIILLNIIHVLGYLGDDPALREFVGIYLPTEAHLSAMESRRALAVDTINRSLAATHL